MSTSPLLPDSITVDFIYSIWPTDGRQPWLEVELNPELGVPNSNVERRPVQHSITNIRGKEAEYGLDDAGFKFIKRETSCVNFQDDDEVRRVYYPESIELIKEHTGARRVILFDHSESVLYLFLSEPPSIIALILAIRRRRESVEEETATLRQPVSLFREIVPSERKLTRRSSYITYT